MLSGAILRFHQEVSHISLAIMLRGFLSQGCVVIQNLPIDLVTVLEAILTSRQVHEKLQCLYENLMSNNFCKTAVLNKI